MIRNKLIAFAKSETVESYEALKASYGKLPGATASLAPLVVPILLMALSSVASMLHWEGTASDLCLFLGNPMVALAVGTLLAVVLLSQTGKSKPLIQRSGFVASLDVFQVFGR